MKTTATIRRVRVILKALREGTLDPRPDFQRRLVWTNKDKLNFLETVVSGFPFPEIYVAAGRVNTDTGDSVEQLVDGQQRVTTLNEYFSGAGGLKVGRDFPTYQSLSEDQKVAFLEYEVVVRDLGVVSKDQIVDVFRRINATQYALNPMEVANARFRGEFKDFATEISELEFFNEHRVFSANEIRRMTDVNYSLTLLISMLFTYFHRNHLVEEYLLRYNEGFDRKIDLREQIDGVFTFIEKLNLVQRSRAWNRTDLFTLIVEVHRALFRKPLDLDPAEVSRRLQHFYESVEEREKFEESSSDRLIYDAYYNASVQGTNDRGARIRRGQIIQAQLSGTPLSISDSGELVVEQTNGDVGGV